MTKAAVIGAGLIGRSWAIVFARAGIEVALWDPEPDAVTAAIGFAAEMAPELIRHGLFGGSTKEQVVGRMRRAESLADALFGADWVQENGPERVDAKQALFAELDRAATPSCILASSTSSIPASAFSEGLRGRARVLVAHPVNPPYLIPVVELSPAPWTSAETMTQARTFMERAGMVPATLTREVQGFVVNRLQAALLGEAFRLVEEGYISAEDVDATIKHGLGLRWAFMGPFETIDLNAPAGLADYVSRYGGPFHEMRQDMAPRAWEPELVTKIHNDRRATLAESDHPARQQWRDRRLMALLAHKAGQPD